MILGNKEIAGNLILAPLAGYSDRAFRKVCRKNGAAIAVTEMVSAEGLARDNEKTEELLLRYEGEDELIMQIFAPDKDPVSRSLSRLLAYKPTAIDINAGCPVPKVVKNGCGSALMKTPEKIYEIVSFLKQNTDVPITVKFRLGWDYSSINYIEFADAATSAGASALTLHARTRSQNYSGSASYEDIKKLRDHVDKSILVFGSGDVFTPEAAVNMINSCGVDGVMFARGAIGNPFIFKQTSELLKDGSYSPISLEERYETMVSHLDDMIYYFGEALAAKEMRKHAAAYLKGVRNANRVKSAIVQANTRVDYLKALEALF